MSHYFWCFCFSNTLALTFTECFHAVCMTVRCLTWSSEEERQQAARVEGGLRKLFGPKFRVACKQRSRYGLRVSITTIALLQSIYIKSTVFFVHFKSCSDYFSCCFISRPSSVTALLFFLRWSHLLMEKIFPWQFFTRIFVETFQNSK